MQALTKIQDQAAGLQAYGNVRARLLPMFPLNIVFGGLELQCLETCNALKEIQVAADLLDFYKVDDEFDILHLFASTPNYYDICHHTNKAVVISAVSGARHASHLRAMAWKATSALTRTIRGLQTNYDRLRSVYQKADAVLCLNPLEAKFLQITYDIPPDRLKIIPNGVNDYYFNANPELFVQEYGIQDFVLFTGNIVPRKNPLRLAKVLRELNYPGVFIGGTLSSEKKYSDEFASIIQDSPNLIWIHRLEHENPLLASAYAAARTFCLPSFKETQSISALEAMATGTPIILGDVPYAYQSPFEQSLKCKPTDEAVIKHCVQLAMENPDLYKVPLPERYCWNNIALEILETYQQVLSRYNS